MLPYADVMAYCLMPNHFHFMVRVNSQAIAIHGAPPSQTTAIHGVTQSHPVNKKQRSFNESIAIMLRSYTRAINKQEQRSGALFREGTKAECLSCSEVTIPAFLNAIKNNAPHTYDPLKEYPPACFNYIHRNPVKATLVGKPEDWEFSSAPDYAGIRKGTLVNKKLAEEIMPELFIG